MKMLSTRQAEQINIFMNILLCFVLTQIYNADRLFLEFYSLKFTRRGGGKMRPIFSGSKFPVFCMILWIVASLTLNGCAGFLPTSGPSRKDVLKAPAEKPPTGIQVVEVTGTVACRLLANEQRTLFSEVFVTECPSENVVGPGDVLDIAIWEAPPGTLFTSVTIDVAGSSAVPATARGTTIPEQMVSADGTITVPFVGQVKAAGHTVNQIASSIQKKLQDIAHQPQVLVRLVRNTTANVTVVGEVNSSTRMPLTAAGERLLDALAAAGGVRQPVTKVLMQVTREGKVYALPLDTIIRDPLQNIRMQPGDVVTALFQPLSFTVLGAAGKNDEVNFEAQGISLAQALARSGGLQDNRADVQGVFIFRLESPTALDWPTPPTLTTPDGKVPVVYRADLSQPATFFAAQSFPIKNRDVLYISNASAVELQKFLNLVFTLAYPALNTAIQIRQ
jgi:polysaccharide export outer membrane protein